MINFNIPKEKKVRVIIDTDAKNEVDDQYAIVQALLTESFDIKGIIAAHFGIEKSAHSEQDSYDEIRHILKLMNMDKTINVFNGGTEAILNLENPVISEGANLIVEESLKDDNRPLYIAFIGPLTDMAVALMLEPSIEEKDITVIWIGGGNWPAGGWEYNLKNDLLAAQYVFNSKVKLWQIPRNVYRMMPVSFAELYKNVYPYGEIGKYLCENVIAFNNADNKRPAEYRILGDSPSIGVILYGDCGEYEWKPAPEINKNMYYTHSGKNRLIKVYKNKDSRFILEDLYAKLALFTI